MAVRIPGSLQEIQKYLHSSHELQQPWVFLPQNSTMYITCILVKVVGQAQGMVLYFIPTYF